MWQAGLAVYPGNAGLCGEVRARFVLVRGCMWLHCNRTLAWTGATARHEPNVL